MLAISRISSGALDYPPSHQWANRPLSYVFTNMVLWGLGLPLGVTVWAGWAGMLWQLVRQKRVSHLLPWVWMTLTFVYHSTQFVKPVRYLLPIYPTMALIAGWCLVRMWERAQRCRRVEIRSLASALLGIVVLGTALWAFAFTGIYTRPVTRIEASRWMYENIPAGSRVTYEYWDDALPLNVDGKLGSEIFEGVRTEPYWEDIPEKREKLYQWLEQADYIVFSSNRLYGSIPRLRTRFPMTTRYYEAVFSGELGFELIQTFTSRPQLLGIEITDDNADESFTVYDHPRVSIFRKRADFDIQKAHALFDPIDLEHVVQIRPKQVATAPNELMLSPEALRTQRQGGTWSELFHRDGLTNRLPVPVWCLLITLLGWASFGLVWPALVRMPDSGLGLARTLGTLLFGYLSWLAASTDLLPFERSSLALILVAIVGAGAAAAWFRRGDLLRLLRERWRWLVASEVLFSVAFLAMLAVRWANPDLWHPAMGGEKPMDFAYLNAIIKSTTFPPYDPWYSGGYLNYYYFGWVPIAALIKFTGIIPAKGYNLALATLFACLLSGAASVTATLVRGEPQEHGQWLPRRLRWGILGGLLVTVAGNLGEVELLWRGLVEAGRRVADPGALGQLGDALRGAGALLKGQTTLAFRPEWWYWNASRMMSHGEINEFPFFSYLYADLHAHVMAMPILVLVIGLACVLALAHNPQRRSEARLQMNGWGTHATQILLLSLGLGASWCANAWDLPTGLALAAVALALGSRARNEAWNTAALARVGLQILCVAVLARVLYAPFHAHYGTAYTSVALWKGERSAPGDLIGIYLPFLFVLVTYLAGTGGKALARTPWWRALALRLEVGHRHTRAWHLRRALVHYPSILYGLVWVAIGVAGLVLLVLMLEGESYSAALAILLVMVAAGLLRSRLGTQEQLILLFIGAGLALTLGVEWVVLQGDIGRMNTVFKFSLQVWILWGMASAAALSWMLPSNPSARQGVVQRRWWRTALVLLAVGMFSYPLLATPAKMNDRMAQEAPHGLDGSAYMDLATYHDRDRELDLGHDAAAIRWLQEHVAGSPVIVEANTPLYRWGGRVSVNTGLPSVIGW
ncbi:MAG: hypothetical protein GXY79_03160, partial [Chloroflexi bacterium]|nr:hypothetical protein [Chloroflexota bacterium]